MFDDALSTTEGLEGKAPPKPEVRLSLPVERPFLRTATSLVEESSRAMGLGEPEVLSLTLAAEELFLYFCSMGGARDTLEIRCRSGVYYVEVAIFFRGLLGDPRAFNITTRISPDDREGLGDLGLFLVSRSVDTLRLSREVQAATCLTLTKRKRYPENPAPPLPSPRPMRDWHCRDPQEDDLSLFALRLAERLTPADVPFFLLNPAGLRDRVLSGDFRVLVAGDRSGEVGGGIAWQRTGGKIVMCFGPYVFEGEYRAEIGRDLVEALLERISRSRAVGVLSLFGSPEFPASLFEKLGQISLRTPGEGCRTYPVFFRHLREDPGARVFCHPSVEVFLREAYERLVLPRMLVPAGDAKGASGPCSVIATETHSAFHLAFLRPLNSGEDMHENLHRHIAFLEEKGVQNLFFEMDLGHPWHTAFAPALLANGFHPLGVLPYGGTRDLLIFQHRADDL